MLVILASATARADGWHVIECPKDREVLITSDGLAIALQGECTIVTISGRANVVTMTSARKVVVTGNRNDALVGPTDEIDVRGDENMVKTSNRDAVVHNSGANNNIYLGTHKPRIIMQLQ